MVYVYAKQSELNKYIGKELTVEEIETTLKDLGMDIKGCEGNENPELKIEITAEKLDYISAVGIARAIKYYKGFETKPIKYEIKKGENKVIVKDTINKTYPPKTACAIIRDFNVTEELLEEIISIQEKITNSFGRERKKAGIGIYPVDNIEFPITYSAEKPEDIIYRPLGSSDVMNANEILLKHDTGKRFAHILKDKEYYAVFRDNTKKVLAMPPIINSHETAKVEPGHSDLFIEVSGINTKLVDNILKVLVTTFIEMGAKAESVIVEYENKETYELNLNSFEDEISLEYINSLIGINVKENEIETLLNKVMYTLKEKKDNKLIVEIPCFRADVWSDSDIADDIARAYGYNNIIPRFPNISSIGSHLEISQFRERISETLAKLGFLEVYTYMLTSTTICFDKMNIDKENTKYIRLIDSEDQGLNMIRTMLLPNSLETLHINRKNKYPQKIFENGFSIIPDTNSDTKATNTAKVVVTIADPKSNYTQIKNILDTLMKLNEIEFSIEENNYPFLIEGRTAKILVKGEEVGFIGEIHPQVLTNFSILSPTCSFELNLSKIFKLIKE